MQVKTRAKRFAKQKNRVLEQSRFKSRSKCGLRQIKNSVLESLEHGNRRSGAVGYVYEVLQLVDFSITSKDVYFWYCTFVKSQDEDLSGVYAGRTKYSHIMAGFY